MVTFLDGPAARECLMLRRAPLYLRVTFNPRAKGDQWDALDQLTDEPKPHEQIHVYRREGPGRRMHLNCRPRSAGGIYAAAEYRIIDNPPPEATVRSTEAWRLWCLDRAMLEKVPSPGQLKNAKPVPSSSIPSSAPAQPSSPPTASAAAVSAARSSLSMPT